MADDIDSETLSALLAFVEWVGHAAPALVEEALRTDPGNALALVGPISAFGGGLAAAVGDVVSSVPIPGTGGLPSAPPDATVVTDWAVQYLVPTPADLVALQDLAGLQAELASWQDVTKVEQLLADVLVSVTQSTQPDTQSAVGYDRQTVSYKKDGFYTGSQDFRARGYNMGDCIEWGVNCRTRAGAYKKESTAQAHAIRKLALTQSGRDLTDIDWETGRYDVDHPDGEESPCENAGYRIDAVSARDHSFWRQPTYHIIEVKRYEQTIPSVESRVDGQLNCYYSRLKNHNLKVKLDSKLNDLGWAVRWQQEETGTFWYAWAPPGRP